MTTNTRTAAAEGGAVPQEQEDRSGARPGMEEASATLRQARKAARNGFFAWPGGYQMAAIMADGACLCVKCFRSEYRRISDSTRNGYRDGWKLAGADILWEGPAETCAHCNAEIPTACGPVEEVQS